MQISDEKVLTQNLHDAGCDDEAIRTIERLLQSGKINEVKKCLSQHRDMLLANVHAGEKCISCLDYFVYMLNKEKEI